MAPGVGRIAAQTIHGQGSTEVVFRRRNWLASTLKLLAFLAVWLAGGLLALVLATVVGSDRPWFLPLWMTIWGVAGLFMIYGMAWAAWGVETLVARPDSLTVIRRLLVISLPRVIAASAIKSIAWIADDPTHRVRVNGRHVPQPAIAVASENGVNYLARGIAEAEARDAISGLEMRLAAARRRAR